MVNLFLKVITPKIRNLMENSWNYAGAELLCNSNFAIFKSYIKSIPLLHSTKFLAILQVCFLFYRMSTRYNQFHYYNYLIKCTEVGNLANFTQISKNTYLKMCKINHKDIPGTKPFALFIYHILRPLLYYTCLPF